MKNTIKSFKTAATCAAFVLLTAAATSCANGTSTTGTDTTSSSSSAPAATDTMSSPSSAIPDSPATPMDTTTRRDSM